MEYVFSNTRKQIGKKALRLISIALLALGFLSNAYSFNMGTGGGGSGSDSLNNTGPNGNGVLTLPGDIATANKKYPVMIWGPGIGTTPSLYSSITRQFAANGLIVFSQTSSGNGSEMKAALDWLFEQNKNPSSPVYQKIDTSKVGVGGHSLGGMSSFSASADPRVKTAILAAGGSFFPGGRRGLSKPTLLIGGTADFATSAMHGDYQLASGPAFMTVLNGAGHTNVPFQATDMMTSWLRWQLLGETGLRSEFLSANCKYCGQGYDSKSKNW
ncbi:poly(ethylene terephthalate) hydrolase family protein [Ketobacter sp.]